MSIFDNEEKDKLYDDIEAFLNNHTISEFMEIVSVAVSHKESYYKHCAKQFCKNCNSCVIQKSIGNNVNKTRYFCSKFCMEVYEQHTCDYWEV